MRIHVSGHYKTDDLRVVGKKCFYESLTDYSIWVSVVSFNAMVAKVVYHPQDIADFFARYFDFPLNGSVCRRSCFFNNSVCVVRMPLV